MHDVVLLNDAQIGVIPPTPQTLDYDQRSIKQAQDLLIKLGQNYGIPAGYIQEQNGRLIHSVAPDPSTANIQISSSSTVELKLHTETAFHPFKPSHLLLMCLRGDSTAMTTFATVNDIVSKLDDSTIKQLLRNAYTTSVDESFRRNGEPNQQLQMPIFSEEPNGEYSICFDEDLMEGIDASSKEALEQLKSVIPSCVTDIALADGDVLVLNNKKVIHGRKPFKPRYDGNDRWLLRLLVIDKLPPPPHYVYSGHLVVTTDFGKPIIVDNPYNWGRK